MIHCGDPGRYPRGQDRQRGAVSATQQTLKKLNCHAFPNLMEAFRHYDKVPPAQVPTNHRNVRVKLEFSLRSYLM